MSKIFKIFLNFSSICLIGAVFLANQKVNVFSCINPIFGTVPLIASCLLYFLIAIEIARISIFLTRFLESDVISEGSISSIESANDLYLPVYLGYFFIALSIQDYTVFLFVFGIIYILTLYSNITYFNPLYFIFGYRFYYAISSNNIKILLITQQHLKKPAEVSFESLKRINDFTFISIKEKI